MTIERIQSHRRSFTSCRTSSARNSRTSIRQCREQTCSQVWRGKEFQPNPEILSCMVNPYSEQEITMTYKVTASVPTNLDRLNMCLNHRQIRHRASNSSIPTALALARPKLLPLRCSKIKFKALQRFHSHLKFQFKTQFQLQAIIWCSRIHHNRQLNQAKSDQIHPLYRVKINNNSKIRSFRCLQEAYRHFHSRKCSIRGNQRSLKDRLSLRISSLSSLRFKTILQFLSKTYRPRFSWRTEEVSQLLRNSYVEIQLHCEPRGQQRMNDVSVRHKRYHQEKCAVNNLISRIMSELSWECQTWSSFWSTPLTFISLFFNNS